MSTDMDGRTLIGTDADGRTPLYAPAPEPERVRFGDQPNQTMPHDWAEQFLRIVYTEHPGVFRSTLPRCAGLPAEEPKTTRRRA
jgi:hypothetical protein